MPAKNALIIIAPGYEEIEALTPVDLLRRVGIQVTVAGLGSREITGSHHICIKTDTTLDTIKETFDAIILPGGMPGTKNLLESHAVLDLVRKHYEMGKLCAAICAAPLALDVAGVLDGKDFTCFPGIEKQILHGIFKTDRVVRDGNIITSRGAGTAIPFSLEIIGYLLDSDQSKTLAEKIVF